MSEPAEGDGIQEVVKRQALYQDAAQRLLTEPWGTKITDAETGDRKDTGVMSAVEEIVSLLMSGKITLSDTMILRTAANGKPALKIIETEDGDISTGIQIENKKGQIAQVGPGLQSQGLVASEFVPLPYYFVSSEVANQQFRNNGGNDGPTGETGYRDPGSPNAGTSPVGDSGNSPGAGVGDGTGWQSINNPAGGEFPMVISALGNILNNLFGRGRGRMNGCGLTIQASTGKIIVKNTDLAGAGLKVEGICGLALNLDTDGSLIYSDGKLRVGGINASVPYVHSVAFDEDTCELTVTTKTMTFLNGILTGVA